MGDTAEGPLGSVSKTCFRMRLLSAFWPAPKTSDASDLARLTSPSGPAPVYGCQHVATESGAPSFYHNGDPSFSYSSAGYSLSGRYVVLTGTPEEIGAHHDAKDNANATWLAERIDSLGLVTALQDAGTHIAALVWDRSSKTLAVVRDRFGRTSLYYGWTSQGFRVSTALSDFGLAADVPESISRDGLSLLLRYGYVPAPYTIYNDVWKVEAGTIQSFMALDASSGATAYDHTAGRTTFWDAAERTFSLPPLRCSLDQAADRIDQLLQSSINKKAEAKTACLLSGGVDSGLVAAAYQSSRSTQIDTFSISFAGTSHRVDAGAREFSRSLGTAHRHVEIEPEDVPGLVDAAITASDEPMADSSLVPSLAAFCQVSDVSSSVLTGEGGDELFMGSTSYTKAALLSRWVSRVPAGLRARLQRRYSFSERARLGGMAAVLSELQSVDVTRAFHLRVSKWRFPDQVVIGGNEPPTAFDIQSVQCHADHPARRAQMLDFLMDLREGQLAKIAVASAAARVSVRCPILDPDLFDLAWRLPHEHLVQCNHHKFVLKHLLRRYVPEELVFRPKAGFGSPVAEWLNGSLKSWAEQLLNRESIERDGLLCYETISKMWCDFLEGQHKWHSHLWPVLVFLAWRRGLSDQSVKNRSECSCAT